MKKIFIVGLTLIGLFAGCATQFADQTQNLSSSNPTNDGSEPSTETNVIVTSPTEPHTGAERWEPESGGIYDVSHMIIQQDQFRLDCLYEENNIMIYSDVLAGNIMVVPYEREFLRPKKENAYTLYVGMRTKMYINHDILYTVAQDYETQQWIVKTYGLLDGQQINTLETKDTFGYTSAKESVLLFSTEENQQRIYRKNLIDGHEDTVLVWDTSDRFSKPIISDIVEGEKGFVFTGNIFTSDSNQSVLCCGFIDLCGNLLALNMYNDEHRVSICNSGILVQDDIPGFNSQYDPEGKYFFYDSETLSIKQMAAQDSKCKIFISNSGKLLIAARIEGDVCSFWIYDLDRGECSDMISYKIADIQVSQYNISISENEHGFYLLLKGNNQAQLIYFGI